MNSIKLRLNIKEKLPKQAFAKTVEDVAQNMVSASNVNEAEIFLYPRDIKQAQNISQAAKKAESKGR